MVELSHPYITTGKTIALTRWTFLCKVMSLLFNMLSRFVIALLLKSKCLLISWLQSPSLVILEPKKIVSLCLHCFPSICHEVLGLDAMILVFWMLSFKPTLSLSSFSFIKMKSLHFLSYDGVFCICEIIDISPSNLDSSLCFIQPGISQGVLCM